MSLPESIKGFTFRFLKIVINSEGITFKAPQNDSENLSKLLEAYLIFVIIHEQNHFMKRYFNQNIANTLCKTPDIKGYNEGGKQLIKLLFGDDFIKKYLNIEQAKYITNINNWRKNSVYEFRKGFMEIESNRDKDKYIVFLSSDDESMCDHSKLFA